MLRYLIMTLVTLSFLTGLAACGDTWEGAKQDTGENVKATGKVIEKTGDKIKD